MGKRVIWIVLSVAAIGAAVWLATRPGESSVVADTPLATTPTATTPEPADPAMAGRSAAPADPAAATRAAATASPTGSGDITPVDIAPGFEYLSKPASEMRDTDPMWPTWRRHQVLQSEPRDESWAPRQEASLRKAVEDSLTARGHDTQRIELPVIECRVNSCEIQAVGWGEDSRPGGFDLQHIMHTRLAGDLGNEFDREALSMMMSSRTDNRTTFLIHLTRKKP